VEVRRRRRATGAAIIGGRVRGAVRGRARRSPCPSRGTPSRSRRTSSPSRRAPSPSRRSRTSYVAARLGVVCARVNNCEHADVAEYVGRFAPEPDGSIGWRNGALTAALRRGEWLLLDELNLATRARS
jgi:hypothetical protein